MEEPELITIIEGPTPEFRPSPFHWMQSIFEGPVDQDVAVCELRTGNGEAIVERCQSAWRDGRSVQLDYPDEMRMRQRINVVAIRLQEIEEGPLLRLWVSIPIQLEEESLDEGDDDISIF